MKPEDSDPIVERFARVSPPAGHAGRVRTRSGPRSRANAETVPSTAALPLRWVLPVAASTMVVIGAVWQSDRASRQVWFDAPPVAPQWSGKGVDIPVLPPRAYWTMSAFDEFATLRGGVSVAPIVPEPSTGVTHPATEDLVATRTDNAEAERPWSPLAPIELDDIAPAPLEVPAITGLEPLTLEPIEIAPIDIIPVEEELR